MPFVKRSVKTIGYDRTIDVLLTAGLPSVKRVDMALTAASSRGD
jgi:hypothetical protein